MPKKLNTEDFIRKSINVHGYRYDYSKVIYINNKTKVDIICPTHGIFNQRPKDHIRGFKCFKCGRGCYNQEEFINRSINIHGDKYDYSLVEYTNSKEKIRIKCNRCEKYFYQKPNNHLLGKGCLKCNHKESIELKSKDTNWFIGKSVNIHGNRYDYTKTNYKSNKEKVNIICKKHGDFKQEPSSHLKGSGCPICRNEHFSKIYTKSKSDFIVDSIKTHGNKYDYRLVNYINSRKKIIIICKKHGNFKQLPPNHLKGNGCPKCKTSKGENKIKIFLDKLDIKYSQEKEFDGCVNKSPLKFDFFIEDLNLCIEYDGRQHFESINLWGGDHGLKIRKKLDKIKNKYCIDNDIELIRIPYWDFENIEDILKNKLDYVI